jgi:anaphase-promoting complex subunit 11
MKVTVKSYAGIAVWKWIANDDTCGICRMAFDSCCTDCKYPGDDCPLVRKVFSKSNRHFIIKQAVDGLLCVFS